MDRAGTIRYLTRRDVEELGISGVAIADAIEATLAAARGGHAVSLPKSADRLADGRLFLTLMAVGRTEPAPPHMAVKIVGQVADNPARGLPLVSGLVVLLDSATGRPQAIMDATWITEARTAALTLVVARRLARADARRIGFVACGAQARAHLLTLREVFPLAQVTACSRRRSTAETFAGFARGLGMEAVVTDEARAAVADQDIVVSSTPPGAAVTLDAGWLAAGCFAALVDCGRPWRDDGFESFEHRVCDDRSQARALAETGQLRPADFTVELADVIDAHFVGRHGEDARAVFSFSGHPLADLAAAALVFQSAQMAETGLLLNL